MAAAQVRNLMGETDSVSGGGWGGLLAAAHATNLMGETDSVSTRMERGLSNQATNLMGETDSVSERRGGGNHGCSPSNEPDGGDGLGRWIGVARLLAAAQAT